MILACCAWRYGVGKQLKLLNPMEDTAATEFLIDRLKDTKTNLEFFEAMKRR